MSSNGKFQNIPHWKKHKKVEPKYLKNCLSELCHNFSKIKADQDLKNESKKIYKNKKNKILLMFKCVFCDFMTVNIKNKTTTVNSIKYDYN